jgi:hypothetical protein
MQHDKLFQQIAGLPSLSVKDLKECQRRLNTDPLSEGVAEVKLTHRARCLIRGSARSPVRESATRSPPPSRRVCGWVAWSRLAMTFATAA